jgi:hypothetical protein
MSIAIKTRVPTSEGMGLASAWARTGRPQASERVRLSPVEQLREGRALLRHLVLAVSSAGVVVYAAIASGVAM